MYVTTFKVCGVMDFPIDMLRYDACYPATQEAVYSIHVKSFPHTSREGARREETVELNHCHSTRPFQPTVRRWESFGWKVVPGSARTMKV